MNAVDQHARGGLARRIRAVAVAVMAAVAGGVATAAPAWAHEWTLTTPSLTVAEGVEFSGAVACIEPTAGGSFSDADFAVTIDWGDGTETAGTIGGGLDSRCSFIAVEGTHTYTVAGSYDLFVVVEDLTLGGHLTYGAQGTATVTVVPNDLGVSLGASPNPVRTGRNLTYTVQVVNGGGSVASDVAATVTLPQQVQFQSMSAPGATCLAPSVGLTGTITCQIGQLTGGASWTLRAVGKVVARGGTSIEASAGVSAEDPDPFTANNTATVSTSVFGRR